MRSLLVFVLLLAVPVLAQDGSIDVKLVNAQMVQMWLTDWDSKSEASQKLRLIKNLDIRGAMLDLTVSPENNIYAAPRVKTSYGQPAVFHLSDTLQLTSFNPLTAAFEEGQTELGIDLRVTPRPVQPGLTFLSVKAEVSRLDDLVSGMYPATTTQSLEESLEIPTGQSLMLAGGLLGDRTRVNSTLYPFLADLPQLGIMFKQTPPSAAVIITPLFR